MDFCQTVFAADEYKYFLDDNPCPHVGLLGCNEATRAAIMQALSGAHYRPPRMRVSSHETVATIYRKKDTVNSKSLAGVMKLGWCKKHQEKVLGCVVALVDWESLKFSDRASLEAHLLRSINAIKSHLKIPHSSNTKLIVGLVCNAKSLSDPSPCGFYPSIEEAQTTFRSLLGLTDRTILSLYQKGRDQYSVQRLENMILEHVGKYHKEEIARLRKAKGDANEAATAVVNQMGGPSNQQGGAPTTTTLESLVIARNRFKIAWHATVVKETKLARRSWEKCYNALHSMPTPLPIDRWVVATIVLWKLISDNFQRYSQPIAAKDMSAAAQQIETDIQAFLIHLNWVVDYSFLFHGGPSDPSLAPRVGEPTPALVVGRLSEAETLQVLLREWYLSDFYLIVANRLDLLKDYLPKPGELLDSRIVCLPAFHQHCAARCLGRIKSVMLTHLTTIKERNPDIAPGLFSVDRVRPDSLPIFLGRECFDPKLLMPFLTTLSLSDVAGRIRTETLNAIVWYQAYSLVQLTSTMQIELADNDVFVGQYGDAVNRLNRLLKDPLLVRWNDITLSIHEIRLKATSALMAKGSLAKSGSVSATPDRSPSNNNPVGSHSRGSSASDSYFATPLGLLAVHRDMITSILYLLFHANSSASISQKYKKELQELMSRHSLSDSASKTKASVGDLPLVQGRIDLTPMTMAERIEGSGGKGSIKIVKGQKLCQASAESAIIFPLLKMYAHFTKPFVESWKGSVDDISNKDKHISSGLTLTIECSSSTPLRLYNIQFHLYRILPAVSGELRRRRELLEDPVRLCWFGDAVPTYFVEVNAKSPVWTTTIFSLPFLPNLSDGTYECGGISADVYVPNSNASSIPAVIRNHQDSLDSTARRRSATESRSLARKTTDLSGLNSSYACLPQGTDPSATTIPVYYNFAAAVEDDYIALFEDYCFDTADNRVHLFLTSQKFSSLHHPRTGSQPPPQQAKPTSRFNQPRATSFAFPSATATSARIEQRAATAEVSKQSTGANSSLAAFANILLLEGHRFGVGAVPGCYFSHLHRPVIRLTKPVAQLIMETRLPQHQHVVEGDDFVVPLVFESTGDLMLSGQLLIPYLEDVVEPVDARTCEGIEVTLTDVTQTSPAILEATPPGYRVSQIELTPKCIKPSGPDSRLVINIRFRCSYAGLFELPIRLDYATPKCSEMVLMHMLRVHVCRPFIASFKLFDMHAFTGRGGSDKVLATKDATIPNESQHTVVPPVTAQFDPFATNNTEMTVLPSGLQDLNPSEFMSICYGERHELLTVAKVAEVQKSFDRDPRMANMIVNAAAQRLLRFQEPSAPATRLGRKDPVARVVNQFYHVEKTLTPGQSLQITPDKFHLHLNIPFTIRGCFVNAMRCPVRFDKVEVQVPDGISSAFQMKAPPEQVVLPGEELTFSLLVKASKLFSLDDTIGRLALYIRRVDSVPLRGVESGIGRCTDLSGGGYPLRFHFNFPRVAIVEQLYTSVSSYPTTAFAGQPFPLSLTVTNASAVPSKKLRLHFTGASMDRYFLLSGRTQTSFVVPGFGTVTIAVSLIPLMTGVFNLPSFELTSEDDVFARSQDLHTIEVLSVVARK